MNQSLILRGLTAAVVMSAVSAPLPSHAQQAEKLEALFELSENASASPGAAPTGETVLVSDESSQTASDAPTQEVNPVLSSLVQVISHPLDARQAATLYVRDIPVLTFIGSELPALADAKATDSTEATIAPENDPAVRAAAIATRIDQFHQGAGDATTIAVRWDAEREAYVVAIAEEDLVIVNAETILPDTTNDAAADALQVTNRLRRLLGGAEPLQAIEGQPQPEVPQETWNVQSVATGRASWYGPGFHGRRTASGEVFNQNALTAAHRTLPFGTRVLVTNLSNNRQVVVRINDRGPFSHGRILDLSAGAARAIGLDRAGVGSVRLEVLAD